ncbi:hypothetical protein [Solimonas variicoloris]|uniref:hypothetical protein n=1 Tax=Solimonas variicoloris TaxID=254408 RepID=UPI000363E783|nr:hypothetical protein [Solimonas variicoloris]
MRATTAAALGATLLLTMLAACQPASPPAAPAAFDPLAAARAAAGRFDNREAPVVAACYTRTDGAANPCWVCHTAANGHNRADDAHLQVRYAFSAAAHTNHWTNLFVDRRAAIAQIGDDAILAWVRADNYTPLREQLATRRDYLGWRPDLDLRAGFDEQGFARDGSRWRAFRYMPFPGTFWASNGSADDVFIRLPAAFYSDADGRYSVERYRVNLAILEAALAVPDTLPDAQLVRRVEPLSEDVAGFDLDGDGRVGGTVDTIRGLPARYATVAPIAVRRWLYPQGTEFLHSVRYLDPDAPDFIAARLKELRYSVKRGDYTPDALAKVYAEERQAKAVGALPHFAGRAETGLLNEHGWQLQAFIEDAAGRLRLQTDEEHYFCMGCHSNLGVTVDQSFSFPRKRPGADGWGYQTLAGLRPVAQAGQREPEILAYFRRARGGDEFRANAELLARWFPDGRLDEAAVRGADLRALTLPSRERALALDKAYRVLVGEQRFAAGRDAPLQPPAQVHRRLDNDETGLAARDLVYRDGRLWLDWGDAR